MEFKPAKCPGCGGALQLPNDRRSVLCMYCGVQVLVQEAVSAAALGSIHNYLRLARSAAQSNNHEEAYEYFTRALELDSHRSEAWTGKANACGWLSSEKSFRIPEMINCFGSAIESCSHEDESNVREIASQTISQVITQYYNRLRQGYSPAFAEEQPWTFYVNRLRDLIKAVDKAVLVLPDSVGVLQTGLYICGDNIGRLHFFRRSDGLPAYRVLPDDLCSTLADCQVTYTSALYRIDPKLQPIVVRSTAPMRVKKKQGLTPFQWFLIGLGLLFLIFTMSQSK